MAVGDLSFAFDPSKGETPQTIARKRQLAEAILGESSRAPRDVGEGLNAIGQAILYRRLLGGADKAESAGTSGAAKVFGSLFGNQFPAAPASPSGAGAPSSASASAPADFHGDELAWTDAKPYQKALLNTISGPESGGRYDVIYGGGKFDDFSRHPNQAVRIQTGPNAGRTSSAAGKYQFLGSTWEDQAKKLGLPDFSPANQDRAAWNLAAETYKAKTGQDIDAVLQSGDPQAIAQVGQVLSPIWTSLPGGIEQGTHTNRFVATYQKALGAGATPAQAQQAAAQEQAPVQVASNDPTGGMGSIMADFYRRHAAGEKNFTEPGQERAQVARIDPSAGMTPAPGPLAAMAPGTTAPAYDPSGLPPLDHNDPMAPVAPASLGAMPQPYAAIQQQAAEQPNDAKAAIARALSGQGQSFPPEMSQQDARPVSGPSITPTELDANSIPQPVKERIAAALMQQQPIGGSPMPLQAPAGVAVPPQAVPSPSAPGKPQGAGTPGEIRKGSDGKNYQYAETTGMAGATGDQGWIETSMAPGGSSPAPQQIAQAAPAEDLSQIPVEAGGTGGALPPGTGQEGPSMEQLMQAASNPWVMQQYGPVVNALLEQKMKASDPATQIAMEKARLDMEKTRIETEQLRNPQMSPADKARLDFDKEKFAADQKKLMELSPGTTVFDPAARQPVFAAPEKAETKPAGIQEYEYAKAQGFPGTYADWEASKKGGMSLQTNADGTVTFQQGSNIKPMTEAQSKDTTFATRAAGALPLVDKFGDALTSLSQSAGGQVPVIGNYMKTPEYQQAEQAGKEFLQAILRKDTGAAITSGETAEYGSVYLPRPGDSPELLAQKKASRLRALEAMKAGMTPQAILAQEKAMAASGAPSPPPLAPATAPKKPTVIDGYTIEEVQ
ncbi:glycoside hydrolase family 24 protein [Mesorhizobium caraganae]|uniref:glycoside hydrolase family 24 protein n=1 Tax=Mesorhizobium caraganae TaxID=483206 RepID=UPI0017839FA1|nr:glycoside hydrolase family 104 protein [Mesorhizobium caraganae]